MNDWEVHIGDCVELLAGVPASSFDAVITDPPYGLSQEPDIAEVLEHWLAGDDYEHRGAGFMGRSWDSFVPGPATWREVLRVMKPGAHLLAFAGARTSDLMTIALRLAGFEVRDTIMWLYAMGMPKSRDIGKDLPEAAGFGTGLKPAHEPIIVARRPLVGTVAENFSAYGTGALNIEAARIRHASEADKKKKKNPGRDDTFTSGVYGASRSQQSVSEVGRWPANLALTHADGCELVGTKEIASDGHYPAARGASGYGSGDGSGRGGLAGQDDLAESHTAGETVAVWNCAPECPIAALDGQSGLRPGGGYPAKRGTNSVYNATSGGSDGPRDMGDVGGASRFFFCAKASRAERDAGLDETFEMKPLYWSSGEQSPGTFQSEGTVKAARNFHETVKPIALMRWLCGLVVPPGGRILDPFCGSGTTGCAAVMDGFGFVGYEREQDYLAIAQARIAHWRGYHGMPTEAALTSATQEKTRREAGQIGLLD